VKIFSLDKYATIRVVFDTKVVVTQFSHVVITTGLWFTMNALLAKRKLVRRLALRFYDKSDYTQA